MISDPRKPTGRRKRLSWPLTFLILLTLLLASVYPLAWARVFFVGAFSGEAYSISRGRPARGSLDHGRPIPPSGAGYRTYSYGGSALGRQYVHSALRATLLDVFAEYAESEPGQVFIVGETGWPHGGRMRPHRTHQSGLSVDIFMPLRDSDGVPVMMSCWPWNVFCYGLEFDAQGVLDGNRIDFDALAGLLGSLRTNAAVHGLRIARIIIAPEYIGLLRATPNGARLGPLRRHFLRRPAWVRHDEHVHIDFVLRRSD